MTVHVNNASASRIKKGNDALAVKDYFRAKKQFTKGLKYNPSPSAFGLATIYSRNDNPFYNLDSAYRYILVSDSLFDITNDRKKLKWKKYGWTCRSIDSLKLLVSTGFYEFAKKKNTVAQYTDFIQNNTWAREYETAIYSRDSLAFFQAVANNDAVSYQKFVATYPESSFIELATDNYHNSQFLELTRDGSLESFKNFVALHPESPQRKEADKVIFEKVTQSNTVEAFQDFALNYSQNTFIEQGWAEFYQDYLFDYSKGRIVEFKNKYPQALNMAEVDSDIALFNTVLLPFVKNGEYGLMNENGEAIILPKFQYVSQFKDGLASFIENDKMGLLDKRGEIRIRAKYDAISEISEGRFIVEKDDLLGLIDRKGKEILPCIHDDMGELSEGYLYASVNESYFYVDYNGNRLSEQFFLDATDFKHHFAIVETETGVGLLNKTGKLVLPALYNQLKWLSDSLLSFSENDRTGIISISGDTISDAKYNYIGQFYNDLALVSNADTVKYIRKNGELAFDAFFETYPNYKLKGDFINRSAIVVKLGKYGRINDTGDRVTELEFENIAIGEKFYPFEKEDYWGLMSLSNKVLVSPKYDALDLVAHQLAITKLEDSVGIIDVNGGVILSNSYRSIDFVAKNTFAIFNGSSYALFIDGNFASNFEYKTISLLNERFVSLKDEVSVVYYDLENKRLVKLKEESE